MRLYILLLIWAFSPSNLNAAPDTDIKKFIGQDYEMLKGFPRSKIKRGKQGALKLKPFSFDLGLGESTSYLLEVFEKREKAIKIAFSTGPVGGGVYMPIYALFDSNYRFINVAQPKDAGIVMKDLVEINPNIKYILLTSIPQFHGKRTLRNIRLSKNEYMVFENAVLPDSVNLPPSAITSIITDSCRLKLIVPTKFYRTPFRKEHGVYLGFGANTGGEKVAKNSFGDDYNAGGGVQFHIGYTRPIFNSDFAARVLLGTSFQGHKEDAACLKGTYMDYNLTYQTKYINIGGGLRYEFNHSIQNEEGERFEFKSKLSPMVLTEVRLSTFMNINIHYIPAVFTTTTKQEYKANRIGFSWNFNFGGVLF